MSSVMENTDFMVAQMGVYRIIYDSYISCNSVRSFPWPNCTSIAFITVQE